MFTIPDTCVPRDNLRRCYQQIFTVILANIIAKEKVLRSIEDTA